MACLRCSQMPVTMLGSQVVELPREGLAPLHDPMWDSPFDGEDRYLPEFLGPRVCSYCGTVYCPKKGPAAVLTWPPNTPDTSTASGDVSALADSSAPQREVWPEPSVTWRGSVSDLATDLGAFLNTAERMALAKALAASMGLRVQIASIGLRADETFEAAWARKVAEGYQYGSDALEQVRFGWELAMGRRP